MAEILDPDTVTRLRTLTPRAAFEQVKEALYRMGGASSDEFAEVFEELVALGILTEEQLEEFSG